MNAAALKFIPLHTKPLLKGSYATDFIYEIKTSKSDGYQSITRETIAHAHNDNAVNFKKIDGEIFYGNLLLIESYLPLILSHVVLYAYLNSQKSLQLVSDAIETINPLQLDGFTGIKFYTYKIKEFLRHLALGLNTKNVYCGEPNIYDHYPVLKNNDCLLYYAENIELFLNILFSRAELKIRSEIYPHHEQFFLKLNLEIIL